MANTEFRVSTLIDNQVPDFIQSDHPVFVQFLKAYYEWLEDSEEGQAIYESRKLLDYADVDRTTEQFMMYFKNKFLPYFPEDILADKAKLIKNIREFYQQKGSEESLKFLFRVLYKEDIEIIYPKRQILIASDGKWKQPQALRLTTANTANDIDLATLEKRRAVGLTSRASCIIENAYRTIDRGTGFEIFELYVSGVNRLFENGEALEVSYVDANGNSVILLSETIIGSLSDIKIDINNRGLKYKSGDPVVIYGGLSETNPDIQKAVAVVNNVSTGAIATISVIDGGYGFRQYPNSVVSFTNDPSDNTGSGAAAQVTAVDGANAVSLLVNTDTISYLSTVTISNTTYQLPNFAFSNANTTLALALNTEIINVAPIETITVTNFGTNYLAEPTIDVASYYATDNATQQLLVDLGRIAAVEVINGGSGYDANTDTIYINGIGNGTGATFSFVANATGHITSVTVLTAGEGYRDTTVSINSANGSGAVLQAWRYGEGETVETAVDDIGRIRDFTLTSRGAGYVSTPAVSLRIKDLTVSNVSGIILNGDQVYQGANANSYTFSATVDSYDSANSILRVFDYLGTLDVELPLKLPTFNIAVSNVVTYGNGLAKANAEFLNGVIKYAGYFLNTDGFLSSDMKLQDDKKYHNFSYVVIAERALADYREALLDILHPSGMSLLGYNRIVSDVEDTIDFDSNVYSLVSTTTEGNVSINSFSSTARVTGSGGTTFREFTSGDLIVFNPDTSRMIVKEIENVESSITMTLDSNTAFIGENRITVNTSNSFITFVGNSEFTLAANDVIRYNANGTIVTALITSVSGNTVNTNVTSNVSLTNALYEVLPSINSAPYIIIPNWDISNPYTPVPADDPYAQYVVSQLRFEADDPLLDDTGKTWSIVNGTPAISSAANTPAGLGSSMYFAGDGAIGTPHISAFNIHNKDAVVEFWIKNPSGYAGLPARQIIRKTGWPSNTGSEFLEGSDPQGNSSSGWRIQTYNNLMNIQNLGTGGSVTTGAQDFTGWTHVAWVRYSNNSLSRLFINGVQAGQDSNPSSSSIDQAISLMIGGPLVNSAYLTGYLKNFRFTVGSLRGYTTTFTPPQTLSPL